MPPTLCCCCNGHCASTMHTHAHIKHPHRTPQADDEAAAGKAKRVKRFSAGLRHSILHGSGPPASWQRQGSESAAQRAAASVHGGARSACTGACDDPARARVPGEVAALVEAALHAARSCTTSTLHAGMAAAEPEVGSRAQRPQAVECPRALSKVGPDGSDSEDEEEEGSLLAFVAALDFDSFAQELERSDVQASLPKGLPSSCMRPLITQTYLQCLVTYSYLQAGNALHMSCAGMSMRTHSLLDAEPQRDTTSCDALTCCCYASMSCQNYILELHHVRCGP